MRVFFCLLFVALQLAWSQSTLLVLSKADHTLNIVDPATLKVIGKAPVGEDPHEVVASADGKFAYVSNYGGGAFNTLAVIDLIAQKALRSIDLGALRGPHGLMFAGGKVWFTAEAAKAIGRYDPATKTVDWILGTGQDRTHMIYVMPGQNRIITTNIASATVSIIDKSTRPSRSPGGDWDETVIPVGKGAEGFDISPNGKELWTANAQDGTVSIIDITARKVTATLPANVRGANRLKFTPDGKQVLIACLSDTNAVVLDATTHQEIKRLPIHGAAGIEIQPDGARAYIASTQGNYVAVVDLKTLEIIGKIDAGPQPDGMAWAVRP